MIGHIFSSKIFKNIQTGQSLFNDWIFYLPLIQSVIIKCLLYTKHNANSYSSKLFKAQFLQ